MTYKEIANMTVEMIFDAMPEKKKEVFRNACYRNLLLTSDYGLYFSTLTVYKEGFYWKADEMYREQQARVLIRHVVTVSETEEKPIRAFINLEVEEAEYYRIDTVLSSEDKYEAMMRRALSELRMFEKKYADLASLKPVFQAIDAIGA